MLIITKLCFLAQLGLTSFLFGARLKLVLFAKGEEMPTIGDMMEVIHRANLGVEVYGATEEWKRKYNHLVTLAGKAVYYDNFDTDGCMNLTKQTELGPMGELALKALDLFLKQNSRKNVSNLL